MSNEILEKLADAVITGAFTEAGPLAEEALAAGIDAKTIIFDSLNKAMAVVGDRYENKQYFLPQVLLSAKTLYQALDVALPKLVVDADTAPGRVVLAVVEGDVHDIGKNIVKAMLTGAGLTVYDLGRDVPLGVIMDKVKSENAQVIATSTLMTPTLMNMKVIEDTLLEENLKGKIRTVIGGSATSKSFAEQIGTDGWGNDANDAVQVVQKLLK